MNNICIVQLVIDYATFVSLESLVCLYQLLLHEMAAGAADGKRRAGGRRQTECSLPREAIVLRVTNQHAPMVDFPLNGTLMMRNLHAISRPPLRQALKVTANQSHRPRPASSN